jgi:UDP-N-acetylmuramate: L-alanyl-gamma-D-glutamyl-meso-diaminopimelate ligase
MNVFPTEDNYIDQFKIFIEQTLVGGSLVYSADDPVLREIVQESGRLLDYIPYREHPAEILDSRTFLSHEDARYPVSIFGRHNMQNISGARTVCELLGIGPTDFYRAIGSFTGAGKRMQKLGENDSTAVFLDFAHAPSKVRATTTAMKEQYPSRTLTAVLELHTFSSLNAAFLPHYRGAFDRADTAIVYYNPRTVEHKKLPAISISQIRDAFKKDGLTVYTDSQKLVDGLAAGDWSGCNLLIMTSGNFDGQDMKELAGKIVG